MAEGWDNVTYRVGERWAVRLPRRAVAVQPLLNEQRWLHHVAAHLDVEVPMPERSGRPGPGFPWPWSVVRWVEGATADVEPLAPGQGHRLAGILRAMHRPAPDEAPANPFRGVPLGVRTGTVERHHAGLEDSGSGATRVLRRIWAEGLAAPEAEDRVWLHGDLHPRNALVREGRLTGLIDWGDVTGGDRATDLAAAWTLLRSEDERDRFWGRYGRTEPLWRRARAWAVLFGTVLAASGDGGHVAIGHRVLAQLQGGATP